MTPPDSSDDPPSARQDKDRSSGLSPWARVCAARRRLVKAVQGRFEGSAAQAFLGQPRSLDFASSIVLFGASLLMSVLPFIILLSSLANHRIDTDLSRHIGLNREGARIVSQLFRSSPAHSAAPIVTALILAAAGTMAVAGSLRVIYERVFGQPHRGWRDVLRFLTWTGVLFGVLATDAPGFAPQVDPRRAAGRPADRRLACHQATGSSVADLSGPTSNSSMQTRPSCTGSSGPTRQLLADQTELHRQLRADQAETNKQVADAVRTGMQSAHDDLRKAIDDLRKAVLGSEDKKS